MIVLQAVAAIAIIAAIAIACLPLIFRLPWNFLWLRHCSDGAAAQKELAG
jgi:hypothetical protein